MAQPTCPQCGAEFVPRVGGGKPQRFCTKACRLTWANAHRWDNREPLSKPCASCGKLTRRFGATPYCPAPACVVRRNRNIRNAAYARYPERQSMASWRHNLRRLYGITADDYARMLSDQGGVCAICKGDNGTTPKGESRRFAVDHDHVTGKVRGLLCHNCNHVLGHAKDSVDILAAAIEYLTTP